MNFAATEDHELLRQAVREFAEKEARADRGCAR